MKRRDYEPDLPDRCAGQRAAIRHQAPDGSLRWMYRVPIGATAGTHDVLIVRLDADGELFMALEAIGN